MRVAVVGSRGCEVKDLAVYLPAETTEIVSGGAKGIDASARDYAIKHRIKLTEFLPEYGRYGRAAPIKRNLSILEHADFVLIFWDGQSKGTAFMIRESEKRKLPHQVVFLTG